MATLPKVLINHADSKSAGGVALRVRTQAPLNSGQKQPKRLQQDSLCFADMTAFVKQHWLVVETAEIRVAVCSLQCIEVNGKAVVLKLGIENKAGAFLQSRVSQGNVAREGMLGVLAMDFLDRFA